MLRSLPSINIKGGCVDIKQILNSDPFTLAGISKKSVQDLNYKMQEAENLSDFTAKDHELVKKCAGYDLLTSSMARTYCMLAANKLMGGK